MSDKKVAPTTDYEDVDDVIGLAEELRLADSGRLSSEEIAEVGEDLGIEQKYIEQARDELVKRREVEAREAVASAAKAKTLRLGLSIGAVGFVVIFGVWAALASSSLGNREAALSAHSAQVASARERQKSVHKLMANRPDSPDKDAELIGAENRVRVELKRCNEALSKYQRAADSFPVSLWADKSRFDKICAGK